MGKFSQKIVAEYNPPRKWIMEEPLSYITDLDETELRCLELVGVEVRGKKITVEIDNLSQLKKIIGLKFDRVLFDNMKPKILKKAVKLSKKFYETEASGNISLKTVKNVSKTGVDRISVGSITHSVPALDLKLEI